MGMYTEVAFAADVDAEAFDVLSKIKDGADPSEFADLHPFFSHSRAAIVLGAGGSAYFPGACHFTLQRDDTLRPIYSASLRANLKNYDGTIEAFFDWIKPHVTAGAGESGYIGHWLHEEDESPTHVYGPRG